MCCSSKKYELLHEYKKKLRIYFFYFLRGQCSTAETLNGYYSREIEKMGNVTAISAAAGNGCGHLSVSGALWVIRALKAVKALSEHRLTGLSG